MGYIAIAPFVRHSTAVSPEAQVVADAAISLQSRREASQTLFGEKAQAISQFHSAVAEAVSDIESGSGDELPARNTLRNVLAFIRALPDGTRMPEFSIEPDGAVSLDWLQSRTRMLSLSISESERLAYAWLDGSDRGHAVANFRNQLVPSHVIDLIRTISAHEPIYRNAA